MNASEYTAHVNSLPGWVREMGITICSVSEDEVVAEWTVAPKHHQGYGIVHGGMHCGVIETVASIGAAFVALRRKQRVVGLENSTSFIRAVRDGVLRAVAKPVTRGRTTQVWSVEVLDPDNKIVAKGQVRLLCLDEGRPLG